MLTQPDARAGVSHLIAATVAGPCPDGVDGSVVAAGEIVSVRSLPAIFGTYLLSSARTGQMLAAIEGGELTARRTAATSALAARYLAHPEARELLVCGTGRLSLNLLQAHAVTRPLERFRIWGRNIENAERIAAEARVIQFALKFLF